MPQAMAYKYIILINCLFGMATYLFKHANVVNLKNLFCFKVYDYVIYVCCERFRIWIC